MKFVRLDQQLSCTFCQKTQQDAKKLIASPDKRTYICDECTLELGRLTPVYFGDAVVVEHRYIADIVRGIQNDGLAVA